MDYSGSNIIIYGAHLVALECYRYLRTQGKGNKVIGFAVSDTKDNPSELEGKLVKCIDEYSEYTPDCTIIIAMPQKYHDTVMARARSLGFDGFETYSLESLSEKKGKRLIEDGHIPFELRKTSNDSTWLDAYVDGAVSCKRFKFPTLYYLDESEVIKESIRFFDKYSVSLEGLSELKSLPVCAKRKTTTQVEHILNVYMAFDASVIEYVQNNSFEPWIRPVQVGCADSERLAGYHYDDEYDDNLSRSNSLYAEMTCAHWIWKQGHGSDYKGLCHYRRLFGLTYDDIFAMKEEGVDAILTTPRFAPGGVGEMFVAETPVKEPVMEAMIEAVKLLSPEETDGFKAFLENRFYFPNNMVIAKNDIYDDYAAWVFPILFRMLETDIKKGYGHENDRHIAYASELLTSYYFMRRKSELKIVFTDYVFKE